MNIRRLILIFSIIFVAGVSVRSINLSREFLGHFGQRQVYNAWVVRNFVKGGVNILDSKMDSLDFRGNKTPSFRDFPLVLPSVAFIVRNVGGSIEFWGRLSSVFFYSIAFILFCLWLLRYFDRETVLYSMFAFAFFPLSLIYSQAFILEMSALAFFFMGIWMLEGYFRGRGPLLLVLGSLSLGVSFATRMIFLLLVITVVYMFYREFGLKAIKKPGFYLSILLMLAVPFLWQQAAWKLAIAGDTRSSLDVTLNTYLGESLLVRITSLVTDPGIAKKIIDNVVTIVFNPVGFTFTIVGLLMWDWRKDNLFIPLFFFCMAGALFYLPGKFSKHDYYYVPMIVPASVFFGTGLKKILEKTSRKRLLPVIIPCFLLLSFRYAAHPAFVTPDSQGYYLSESEAVQKIVPEDAKIAVAGAGADFLYYCDRPGWVLYVPDQGAKDRLSTLDVLTGGKYPDTPLEVLRHYEKYGLGYVIVFKDQSGEYGQLSGHLEAKYKKAGETENTIVYKRNDV